MGEEIAKRGREGGWKVIVLSLCEAASWLLLLLLVYRQLSRLQISLLLTVGRKLAQNCVFPICVDLFPMFAPSLSSPLSNRPLDCLLTKVARLDLITQQQYCLLKIEMFKFFITESFNQKHGKNCKFCSVLFAIDRYKRLW